MGILTYLLQPCNKLIKSTFLIKRKKLNMIECSYNNRITASESGIKTNPLHGKKKNKK